MTEANQQVSRTSSRLNRRWGVLLAGGDGTRLQMLTRLICGDDRPKQFLPLFGPETLLAAALRRAEQSISPEQILIPLTRSHETFYLREPGIRASQRIVQPANKGTAPPILYSLLSIERNDDDALVAILPCDHYYSDELAFSAALDSAFNVAAQHPGSLVLLGASPRSLDVEYGWIELGPSVDGVGDIRFTVRAFRETPSFPVARELLRRGSLWNTFVTVGHVRCFLEIANVVLADIVDRFRGIQFWAGSEARIQYWLYDRIRSVDFSREVLPVQTRRLVALRMSNTGWSDLGHPERVIAALREAGLEPRWMKKWTEPVAAGCGARP
jgi:mannose-1-phosphate guanylyltransferase